jgi:putative membrane protein
MALIGTDSSAAREGPTVLVFLSGLAAASAMILPGVSGGYLLLLLGQYESILGTVDQLKRGLLGDGAGVAPDLALILDSMHVVIPLGLGIVAGVIGVSNLLKWLLHHYEKATLGALLGLLLGAVVGLWPFQQGEEPQAGDIIKGRVVSVENVGEFDDEDWPVRFFEPKPGQAAAALALIGAGLAATLLIGRIGGDEPEDESA